MSTIETMIDYLRTLREESESIHTGWILTEAFVLVASLGIAMVAWLSL